MRFTLVDAPRVSDVREDTADEAPLTLPPEGVVNQDTSERVVSSATLMHEKKREVSAERGVGEKVEEKITEKRMVFWVVVSGEKRRVSC